MGRTATTFDRARERWTGLPRWVRWPVLGGAAFGTLGFVLLVVLWFTVDLPDEPPELLESAVVVSESGEELAVLSKGGQRFEVPLTEVAPIVVDALIAAEDRRFYSHGGVDPIGIGRALWTNLRTSGTEGGSTLTQQLVKNEYLSSERTLWRKAREAVLSVKLERTADKDEILERYLNTVYFGRGAYGIEAAARNYFDTSAATLDLPQAALLVGLLRSPETADPVEQPEEAAARRSIVLDDLVETDVITAEEAAAAEATPITATPRTSAVTLTAGLAPHFVEWVRAQTISAVGEAALYSGGLRVITTLDLAAQAAAEAAVHEVLTDPAGPQAALVALDTDGAIRAHVGGRDFNALQVDLVRGTDGGGSGRQPGSAFKPFVLEAALEADITLGDRYPAPAQLDVDVAGAPFSVDNYGNQAFGDLTVAEATAQSVNTVYAQLVAAVGPAAVADAATTMGIDAELEPLPSIALGAEEVSPLDLASAYLTLADDGNRVEPYAIVRIEDNDGRVLWEPDRDAPERAIDEGISRAVTHALRGVIDNGTGQAAGIGRPAAGKTGTTQDNVDAWFAGYVPGYAAVVWMGYPEPAPMDDVQGRTVTGGAFPAEIWARFMEVALEGRDEEDFPAPPDELLGAGDEEPVGASTSLSVDPPEADPGETVTVTGIGFDVCEGSWSVEIEGTTLTAESGPGEIRAATFRVPDDLPPGTYGVVATCDGPDGALTAEATLVVRDAAAATSTTTSTVPDGATTTSEPVDATTTTEPAPVPPGDAPPGGT